MKRCLFVTLAALATALPMMAQITASSDELVNFETLYLLFNVRKQPFDDVLVRYALTLATDRERISRLVSTDAQRALAARGLLPPYAGYLPPEHVFVMVAEKHIDLLRYDPAAARDVLAASRWRRKNPGRRLGVEILAYSDDETEKITAALTDMWRTNLDANVKVALKPWHEALTAADAFRFDGVALDGRSILMSQPDTLLSAPMFKLEKIGWTDREIMTTLNYVGSEPSYSRAADKLRNVEQRLLTLMPIIPLFSRRP